MGGVGLRKWITEGKSHLKRQREIESRKKSAKGNKNGEALPAEK